MPGRNGRLAIVGVQESGSASRPPFAYTLFTAVPNGSDLRTVVTCIPATSGPPCAEPGGAAWSPDGTRLALGYTQLIVMNADGSGGAALPQLTRTDSSPSWSPDGHRLVFLGIPPEQAPGYDVYTVRTDGTDLRRLTFGADAVDVEWSARGRIAYASRENVHGHVTTVDPDGSRPRTLLPVGEAPHDLDWAPDGRRLTFTTAGNYGTIWTAADNGSRPRRLVRNAAQGIHSPDGRRFLFAHPTYGWWVARPDGTHRKRVRINIPRYDTVTVTGWQPLRRR
jgi:dipeptidyl aminopeptidase/acylaminoacyl peptidase